MYFYTTERVTGNMVIMHSDKEYFSQVQEFGEFGVAFPAQNYTYLLANLQSIINKPLAIFYENSSNNRKGRLECLLGLWIKRYKSRSRLC